MPTKKQIANLKRGGMKGTAASAARAREAKAAHAAEDHRLGELAAEDPYAYYDELHRVMGRQVVKLLRAEERNGGTPSREVTDRLREFRQLTEALNAARLVQGTSAEAEQFFAQMEARLRAGAPNLGEKLHPYLEEPPRQE
jgi:hypothetical protein